MILCTDFNVERKMGEYCITGWKKLVLSYPLNLYLIVTYANSDVAKMLSHICRSYLCCYFQTPLLDDEEFWLIHGQYYY